MFLRALLAFVALPGIVAIALPASWVWISPGMGLEYPAGLALLVMGLLALLWCACIFYVSGKGTLAPWSPPKNLVITGPYRYTRNPMYVSVATMLAGWAVSFASWALFIYAVAVAVAFHVQVVYGEEPWLRQTHGTEWHQYASRVPRWFCRASCPQT